MLNPRLDLPLPARLLLGVTDAPSTARDLAQRSSGAIRELTARVKTNADTPEAPTGPLVAIWGARQVESLPYGCAAVVVPLVGGTPVDRVRLLSDLENAVREHHGARRIDVAVGLSGPVVFTVVQSLLDVVPFKALLDAAAQPTQVAVSET